MGPGQEEPAVEGDRSPYAPHTSPLAHAPDPWSRGTAARLPCLVCGRAGNGESKAAETIPAEASFRSGDKQERCCDSDGVRYPPGSPLRWRGDLPIAL